MNHPLTTAILLTELGITLNQQQNEQATQRSRQENIQNAQEKLEKQQRNYTAQLMKKQQHAHQSSHPPHDAHQACINGKGGYKRR